MGTTAVQRTPGRPAQNAVILPTLLGGGYNDYQVRPYNFLLSFCLHILGLTVLFASAMWAARHPQAVAKVVTGNLNNISLSDIVLPPSKTQVGGGGGGGDHDKLQASLGKPPKFSMHQFTPPEVVIRNTDPKMSVEPTVVVPPEVHLNFPTNVIGDPKGVIGPPSNGLGSGGGIGSGSGGGVGSGYGPGVGPGYGGGIGGGVFRVGGGVSAPRLIYDPDPEYSDEARKAKYQGVVVLWVVVAPDGMAHDIRVQRSLGMGLDEKAIEAVKKWKFEPAKKDGQPVSVMVNVEVSFRLY